MVTLLPPFASNPSFLPALFSLSGSHYNQRRKEGVERERGERKERGRKKREREKEKREGEREN